MFHGVAGKWSQIYDRPEQAMGQWDRFFFINRRRLQNFIASGALEPDSPAIRLVGMPKSDCLVDGSLTRDGVLMAQGIDPVRPTVLYAPTWTRVLVAERHGRGASSAASCERATRCS
jgi:hypothetical protein